MIVYKDNYFGMFKVKMALIKKTSKLLHICLVLRLSVWERGDTCKDASGDESRVIKANAVDVIRQTSPEKAVSLGFYLRLFPGSIPIRSVSPQRGMDLSR